MVKRVLSMAAAAVLMFACSASADTIQGRTISYEAGKSIVIIENTSRDMKKTDYKLPAKSFALSDATQVDIAPVAGCRMRLDVDPKRPFIRFFNGKSYEEVDVKILKDEDATADSPSVKGQKFPKVDKAAGTMTVWAPRRNKVVTFSMDAKYLAMPDNTWVAGNEVLLTYTGDKVEKVENLTKKKK